MKNLREIKPLHHELGLSLRAVAASALSTHRRAMLPEASAVSALSVRIRCCLRRREYLVGERTRLVNRIRQQLWHKYLQVQSKLEISRNQ